MSDPRPRDDAAPRPARGGLLGMLYALGRGWMVVAHKIGHIQAQVMMFVVYFVVIAPFGLIVRVFTDPLNLRAGGKWQQLPTPQPDLASARQQF